MLSLKSANLTSTNLAAILKGFFLSLRPKTLVAAIAPVVLLSHLAWTQEPENFHSLAFLFCLGVALSLQVATNFLNDLSDQDYGSDTTERKGPLRGLQLGLLTRSQLKTGAFAALGLAAVQGLWLLNRGGWPFFVLGAFSLLFCYGYTAGIFRLARRGLGDLFVLLFFGWVAGMGSYYLQNFSLSLESLVLATQVGLLATVLIAVNNFRDLPEDASTGKRTLAVRLGEKNAKRYIGLLLALVFLMELFWWKNLGVLTLLPLMSLTFFSALIWKKLGVGPGNYALNKALALGGANQLFFVICHIAAWTLAGE
jgi:1,4-dihydroxy-2-naphthoate octaprenyltransferase